MPIRRRAPLALLALLCLAGCGPPKAQTPGHYALKGTADCLRKGGAKVVLNQPGSDLVAQSAPAGALLVTKSSDGGLTATCRPAFRKHAAVGFSV